MYISNIFNDSSPLKGNNFLFNQDLSIMKKSHSKLLFAFLLLFVNAVCNGADISDSVRFASIVDEADILYAYEKIAWNASDIASADNKVSRDRGT